MEMRARNGVQIGVQFDDAFGEQVIYALSPLWDVGCENVVKTAIFTNDYDYMLDWRCGLSVVRSTWLRLRCRQANSQLRYGKQCCTGTQSAPGPRNCSLKCHAGSFSRNYRFVNPRLAS